MRIIPKLASVLTFFAFIIAAAWAAFRSLCYWVDGLNGAFMGYIVLAGLLTSAAVAVIDNAK